jgi:hypothetical protein
MTTAPRFRNTSRILGLGVDGVRGGRLGHPLPPLVIGIWVLFYQTWGCYRGKVTPTDPPDPHPLFFISYSENAGLHREARALPIKTGLAFSLARRGQLMPLTDEQATLAKQLRAGGMSYERIAKQIGISESASWKHFNPRPRNPKPPPPKPRPPPASLLPPPTLYHGSIPIQRHVTFSERNSPQPTRNEMYASLRTAVLNTRRA